MYQNADSADLWAPRPEYEGGAAESADGLVNGFDPY